MIWAAVMVGCLGCYAWKIAGLSLPAKVMEHPRVVRIAALMPVALLAALIGVQAFASGQHMVFDARVVGVGVAAFAVWRKWPFLVVVVLAAAATALIRLVMR